jgi:hypothetical protein
MNFEEFNNWLMKHYSFNAFENDFFEKSLYNAYNSSASTSINGVSLPVLYQDHLFEEFLKEYKSYLQLLLRQMSQLPSDMSMTLEGISLNDWAAHLQQLKEKVALLDGQ